MMACHQFARYGERRNNMTAGAATSNEDAQFSQVIPFHKSL
jgi:hypothetical protein